MTFEVWSVYMATVLLFMSTPGPSHLLVISVSMSNGFQRSLATAAGDLTANALQIILAGLGLAVIVTNSQYGFSVVKWLGVTYLIWIGVRTLLASFNSNDSESKAKVESLQSLWLRGFITSAANPKAVVFFAALFPQFLNPNTPVLPQIAILGSSYIVVDGLFLASYGRGAEWIAQKIKSHYKAWIDRFAGLSLIAAAIWLGMRTNEK